jgi:hypothetical protein
MFRDGIEPSTQRFSVFCSTPELSELLYKMKVKIVIVSSLNNTIVTVVRDGKVVWWATPGLDAGAKRGSSNAAEALGGFVGRSCTN